MTESQQHGRRKDNNAQQGKLPSKNTKLKGIPVSWGIEFSGVAFDGKLIRIRDKTISKYYNRLYRKHRYYY